MSLSSNGLGMLLTRILINTAVAIERYQYFKIITLKCFHTEYEGPGGSQIHHTTLDPSDDFLLYLIFILHLNKTFID